MRVATAARTKPRRTRAHQSGYTRLLSPISGRIGRSAVTEVRWSPPTRQPRWRRCSSLILIYVDVTQPSAVLLRLKRELAAGQLAERSGNEAEVH